MATVKILYFGSIRDITGTSAETLAGFSTLPEILGELRSRYPAIDGIRYQVSLNRQLLPTPQTSNPKPQTPAPADGDEIALLPPFAGG